MDYKDVKKILIEKDLKLKDLIYKLPKKNGEVYTTKAGIINALKHSKDKKQNCKRAVNFLIQI
ncbi:hypothetical protein [Sebaldella sp. S0638]|uniref:hypothetical protein n=1 Tax=Sebaldella sp. S0638 TaxID=2957809 RepID=UPI0020A1E7E7|nr:hypothetical protein [Sebaldella sp. S0638]MCP1225408.1 hypothetical protein [Sebaldella sp. S0638]